MSFVTFPGFLSLQMDVVFAHPIFERYLKNGYHDKCDVM